MLYFFEGAYVTLAKPGRRLNNTMRDLPIVVYDDMFWPLPEPTHLKLEERLDVTSPFHTFSFEVSADDFDFSQVSIFQTLQLCLYLTNCNF